jgi:4-hydroxy-tetrahydrodipicolinate reductase
MQEIQVILGGSEGKMGQVLKRLIGKADDMALALEFDPKKADSPAALLDGFRDMIKYKDHIYVDFTEPDAVMDNVKNFSELGLDSVIGTTKWYDKLGEMEKIAKSNGRRIIYAPNFSIGVNATFAATKYLSKLLGPLGFDTGVLELHHTRKKDSPSGTAETLGKILIDNVPGKNTASYVRLEERPDDEIDVLGGRVGSVTGYHMIVFSPKSGDYERLTIEHNASNRDTFGMGALKGIRWLYNAGKEGKEPGVYNFGRDVLGLDF